MVPIAGLCAQQVMAMDNKEADFYAPPEPADSVIFDKRAQYMYLTALQWGIIFDTSFFGPRYQDLIGYIGRFAAGDTPETQRDQALKLIVELHDTLGQLHHQKISALNDVLQTMSEKRRQNMANLSAESTS